MSSKLYSATSTDHMMWCMGERVPMFKVTGSDPEECGRRLQQLIDRYEELKRNPRVFDED